MNIDIDISTKPKNARGHTSRERRDIASGELRNPAHMIRFVCAPDGQLVADIFGKLPGRGAWVAANREAVIKAVKTGAFARATKTKISVSDNFIQQIESGLSLRLMGLLGMAKRAGQLETGFDNVRSCARIGALAIRLEARDGKQDGRSKIRVIAKAVAKELQEQEPLIIGCFTRAELGQIIGRDHLVHAGVKKGKMARTIVQEALRLAGFREMVPEDWPDRQHESEFSCMWDKAR